jgi:hypothetical protein
MDTREAITKDRAELAQAMSSDLEFIAIVESSEGAVADPTMRKRLILLGSVKGSNDQEKINDAKEQVKRKSKVWEYPVVLYKLVKIE